MLNISSTTRISALIAADTRVIDRIAEINPHFKKLQNPILRKVLASRVTISDAAKIGKCSVEDIFNKLKPLGFKVTPEGGEAPATAPETAHDYQPNRTLDVREDIASGNDPFKRIMQELMLLEPGEVLLLINSFEPTPLIRILDRQGYGIAVIPGADDTIHTFFRKPAEAMPEPIPEHQKRFEKIAEQFAAHLRTIDVRHLPMPQPMVTILRELELLPKGMALFVQHKKVPMFLLPELKEKGYEAVHRPHEQGVQLIIYKP